MKRNILIIGAGGMFGQDACKIFKKAGYHVIAAKKSELDICNINSIRDFINKESNKNKIDFIISAAAYTKVDDAEFEESQAFLVNSEGARNVAMVSNENSIPVFYISTDYVFDGKKTTPYLVDDQTNPINVYGASKLAGEKNTMALNPKSYIVRTSWLYGKNGKNFVDTMINLSKTNSSVKIVKDQFGCPTSTYDLAFAIKEIIEEEKPFGIYHACGSGYTNWYGFAKKVFDILDIHIEVLPVEASEFKSVANRPKYSVMENYGLCDNWEKSLRRYLSS